MVSRFRGGRLLSVPATFWHHRELLLEFVRRDVVGRYRGSVLGLLWSFFHPLFMLTIYTFVFGTVFRARSHAGSGAPTDFALFLFVGLTIFGLFTEVINRSPSLILENANYVKRVVFPLEILPLVASGSALFHTLISMLVLVAFFVALEHYLPLTAIFLPLFLVPLLLLTLGLAWFLAALGVYLRDISQTIGILTTALLFLSPVFYPASALPEAVRGYLFLNPIAFVIEQARAVLIDGHMPNWAGWAVYCSVSVLIAIAGLYWFQRTRAGFADVL